RGEDLLLVVEVGVERSRRALRLGGDVGQSRIEVAVAFEDRARRGDEGRARSVAPLRHGQGTRRGALVLRDGFCAHRWLSSKGTDMSTTLAVAGPNPRGFGGIHRVTAIAGPVRSGPARRLVRPRRARAPSGPGGAR